MDKKSGCFSVDELGRRLGVSRPIAYNVAHTEGFPAIRIGRRLLIIESRFEEWLAKQAGKQEASCMHSLQAC